MSGLVIDLDMAHADLGQDLGSFRDVRLGLDHEFEALASDLAFQVVGGAFGDHPAVVDDGDGVGELVGLIEKVGGQQEGGAFPDELGDDGPEIDTAVRVETGGRLVEEDDLWLGDQRAGEVEASAHSPRVGLDLAVAGFDEVESLEQLAGSGPTGGLAHVIETPDHFQILETGEVLVDGGVLT